MHNKNNLTDFILSFCIITACITLVNGILGCIFMPDIRFGYEAFFSPPLFGLLTALTGIITKSRRELSTGQTLSRLMLNNQRMARQCNASLKEFQAKQI